MYTFDNFFTHNDAVCKHCGKPVVFAKQAIRVRKGNGYARDGGKWLCLDQHNYYESIGVSTNAYFTFHKCGEDTSLEGYNHVTEAKDALLAEMDRIMNIEHETDVSMKAERKAAWKAFKALGNGK